MRTAKAWTWADSAALVFAWCAVAAAAAIFVLWLELPLRAS